MTFNFKQHYEGCNGVTHLWDGPVKHSTREVWEMFASSVKNVPAQNLQRSVGASTPPWVGYIGVCLRLEDLKSITVFVGRHLIIVMIDSHMQPQKVSQVTILSWTFSLNMGLFTLMILSKYFRLTAAWKLHILADSFKNLHPPVQILFVLTH